MSDIAIRVENLGKEYRIGRRQERYKRFTETVMDTLSAPIRRLRNLGKPTPPEEIIWALKDVSFEVKRGEVLGIIGRNGAGKTTLLKILSRITEPTEGRVEIHGRVGSLLEVGTGFHPELTGRENIYLNGAILGMKRAEIERRFDEIVAFSEIVKFLDTPVKRYSSGMYVRLAFAVAAHLEPEILLVDEVLSVGDAAFQKKCLGKMGEVAQEGRTVLFVSHNMDSIASLSSRGIVVNQGHVVFDGNTPAALRQYRKLTGRLNPQGEYAARKRTGLVHARVLTSNADGFHEFGKPLTFEFEIALDHKPMTIEFAFQILDESSRPVLNPRITDVDKQWSEEGQLKIRCVIPAPRLYKGRYSLRTFLGDPSLGIHYETVEGICEFEVVMDNAKGSRTWPGNACVYVEDVKWVIG